MGVILGLLGMILLSLFIRLLGVEIGARHKPLCHWLVRVASARLPAEERAALESEWLQIIEDLRSPTVQLLHSLSYVVSALRIRKAIAPEAHVVSVFKIVITIQLAGMGVISGAMFAFLFEHKDAVVGIVQQHVTVSKPVALVVSFAIILVSGVMAYVNHRLMMWYFSRRARRRASTPIE
jgi:hypothetical protein